MSPPGRVDRERVSGKLLERATQRAGVERRAPTKRRPSAASPLSIVGKQQDAPVLSSWCSVNSDQHLS